MDKNKIYDIRRICENLGLDEHSLFIEFWGLRFPDNSITDYYIKEWINRFLSGNPTKYMDSESLDCYLKAIKNLK